MNHQTSIIRFLGAKLAVYLSAILVAYGLASISSTQSVISSLAGMGITIGLADRVAMTLSDLSGMAGMFLPMIAFAFLAAFLVSALICRWWGTRWRTLLYALAGATALVTIHLTLNLAFAVTPIAIARTWQGLLVQGLAGAAGGFTYIHLTLRLGLARIASL